MRLRFRQELDLKLLLKIVAVVALPPTEFPFCVVVVVATEGCNCKSTKDLLRGAAGQSLLWQLGHFLLRGGTCGTLNTGSLLKETLLCNRLDGVGGLLLLLGAEKPREPLLAFLKPYLGGLASEVSLHLLGNVGKCILDKDGWKTDSALPGAWHPPGVNTKLLGSPSSAAHVLRSAPHLCSVTTACSDSSPGQWILKLYWMDFSNSDGSREDRQNWRTKKMVENHHYNNNRFPSAVLFFKIQFWKRTKHRKNHTRK